MGLGMQHLYALPPSLRQRIPTLPPAVEQVILKALAKKPQQRFATITEFAEALEEASQTALAVTIVVPIEQNPLPSYPSDIPTVLLAEPAQKQYVAIKEVMPLQSTQPSSTVTTASWVDARSRPYREQCHITPNCSSPRVFSVSQPKTL